MLIQDLMVNVMWMFFAFQMSLQIYGQIPEFNKKISTVRSRGLALIPITQNKGQLDNRYPNKISDEIIR